MAWYHVIGDKLHAASACFKCRCSAVCDAVGEGGIFGVAPAAAKYGDDSVVTVAAFLEHDDVHARRRQRSHEAAWRLGIALGEDHVGFVAQR